MTATYDLSTDNGKLRLLIGDKDVTNTVFTDEELAIFLTQSSIYLAAAEAMEAWASTYAANANREKIGDYEYTQKTVDDMLKMAKEFREKENFPPVTDWAEFNLNPIVTP